MVLIQKAIRYIIYSCYSKAPIVQGIERQVADLEVACSSRAGRVNLRGVAQPGLERLVRDQEVGGSNPPAPISFLLCADLNTGSNRALNIVFHRC